MNNGGSNIMHGGLHARLGFPDLTPSGKEAALVDFYAQLRRDGLTVCELARRARVGRTALTLILNGHRSGRHTWKHLLPQLSEAALSQLKQCSAWNTHAEEALAEFKREVA